MDLESGKISNIQMIFLVTGFCFGDAIIVPPGSDAGHDVWIAVFIGIIEALIFARVFTALSEMFINKTGVEINDLVYGRYLGKVFSLIYLLFLFHILVLLASIFTDFFSVQVYTFTPKLVIIGVGAMIGASATRRGIETIARTSLVLVPLTIMIIVIDTLMGIPLMDINNILPLLDISTGTLLAAAHNAAMLPLAQTIAFLMVLPFLNHQKKRFAPIAAGITIAGIFLALAFLRNSLILGPLYGVFKYPTYMVLEIINIQDVFSRMEILVTIFFIFMSYLKGSFLLYCINLGTAQMCKLRSYYPLIIPTGILVVIFCLTNVRNAADLINFLNKTYPIYSTIPLVFIPILTLIIAKLRKLPQSKGVSQ